jgi:hypothetical protein
MMVMPAKLRIILLWAVPFLCHGWTSPSIITSTTSSWPHRISPSTTSIHRLHASRLRPLAASNNNNQFDMSKPTFDLLSFRPIRSDALLRYNSLNQSEPLRINLYLLLSATLLLYPSWCESVTSEIASPISTAVASVAGIGCGALFWRERSRRSNQLYRMEKELNAEKLVVRYSSLNSAISSTRYTVRLGELKSKRRILAIRGTKDQIASIWDTVCALRNRLIQSSTLVVFVPTTEGSTIRRDDCTAPWLAEARDGDGLEDDGGGWLNYFRDLLDKGDNGSNADDQKQQQQQLAWFALNFKGRSIASGIGDAPRLLELLGQQLQPMVLLDETDEAEGFTRDSDSTTLGSTTSAKQQILECQQKFYDVLTNCTNANEMKVVFANQPVEEVDEVIDGGGRIDAWGKCLELDARPVGMVISGSDAYISHENVNVAYSTCIEFPRNNVGGSAGTLLAMQRWVKEDDDYATTKQGDNGGWKLELHQTIPWSANSKAGGTLRCDCRGCVALTRSPERRTLGGLIG